MKYIGSIILCLILLFCRANIANAGEKWQRASDIVDGDTIRLVDGQLVRYIGIDTPETRKRVGYDWVYAPKLYAQEAKEYNEKLVRGKNIRLEFDAERKDKYNRLLAYIYLEDGTMVNSEILKQGYAKILIIPPNTKHIKILKSAQSEAQAARRGMWSD